METKRIAATSGKLKLLALKALLHSPLAPKLNLEPEKIAKSRLHLDVTGHLFPLSGGVKIRPTSFGNVRCQEYTPKRSASQQVLLYFHGGGYCVGSPTSHRHILSKLARQTGFRTIAVDYRKSPENPFPAAINDAFKVYDGLLSQGVNPSNIALAGDSAGGNLVLTTLLRIREENKPMPFAACCISPWTDLTLSGQSLKTKAQEDWILSEKILSDFADNYAPVTPTSNHRKNPMLSPLFADFSGFPPTLIQVGTCEVLLDDSLRLAKKMAADGVVIELQVWENMQHVWHYTFPVIAEGRAAIRNIATFFHSIASS